MHNNCINSQNITHKCIKASAVLLAFSIILTCTSCFQAIMPFDASPYEQFFTPPYTIEGSLNFNGNTYKVQIKRDVTDNTAIFFYDGDITQGLTITFQGDDVFLSFDDQRFKTNAQLFTDLRTLNRALDVMQQSMYPKQLQPADTSNNAQPTDIITASVDGGAVTLYANHGDNTPLRLQSNIGGVSLYVDIASITTQNPEQTTTAAYTTQLLPPVIESTAIPTTVKATKG